MSACIELLFEIMVILCNCLHNTRRYALLGMDMSLADYDGRTAIHLAAAEGHEPIVRFLLEKCNVSPYLKDRYVSSRNTVASSVHNHTVKLLSFYS